MNHKFILVLALIICIEGCCHREPVTASNTGSSNKNSLNTASFNSFKLYSEDVHSIYFGFNKAKIEGESIIKIKDLISKLRKVRNAKVVIYGYTDRLGQDAYNAALAMRRINAVKKLLMQSGVIKANNISIDAKAVGERDPLISYDTINNNPTSRRVDIFITS